MVSSNSELPVQWALAGLGVTQKSWWEVQPYLASGQLHTLLDAYEPAPAGFFAIHPVRSSQSRKISLFLDVAVAYFRDAFGPDVAEGLPNARARGD